MRKIGKLALGALVLAGLALPLVATTSADAAPDRFGGRGFGGPGPRGFGAPGGWNGGHWVHGFHGPRYGWWWTVGPSWHWYSQPVYPYPAYYPPDYDYPDAYPTQRGYYPPVQQQGPAPQQYWYYCDNPRGYYPYVGDCAEWRQVPTAPPPTDLPPEQLPER